MLNKIIKTEKFINSIFIIILLIIAINIYKDYGIGWDEGAQIGIARYSCEYIFNYDKSLLNFQDRDYGVAFELPIYIIQKNFSRIYDQYYFRHLMIHLLFLFSVFLFYKINYYLTKNKYIALLASLILVISPRIYGDSFHNSKDLVLLSTFIISFYTFIKYFETLSIKALLLHSLAMSITTNIRIIGILFLFITLLNLILNIIYKKNKWETILMHIFLIIISFSIFLYISWPYLWLDPWNNFLQVFENMKHFRWEGLVLFMGKLIEAPKLPWYYLFIWIGITTPVLYIILFLIGTFILLKKFIFKFKMIILDSQIRIFYYALIIFATPIFMIIILKSIIYDGWRHVFFIYPFMVIIMVFAIDIIYKKIITLSKKIYSYLFVLLILANISYIAWQMIYYHPFQNCYFNHLISHKKNYIRHHFEMDYWGLSNKQALEYLISKYPLKTDTIIIKPHLAPTEINLNLLKPNDRNRIIITYEFSNAQYYITNYRNCSFDHKEFAEEIFKIEVHNSSILSIFRIR